MQVASNGFISFGQPFFAYIPHSFPVQEMIVAPYWDDIDLSQKGVVLYSLINDTVSDLVDQVNDYISSKYTNFQAKWILGTLGQCLSLYGCHLYYSKSGNKNLYNDVLRLVLLPPRQSLILFKQ